MDHTVCPHTGLALAAWCALLLIMLQAGLVLAGREQSYLMAVQLVLQLVHVHPLQYVEAAVAPDVGAMLVLMDRLEH